MNKVPVVATAVAAYRFAFGNYVRLLGVTWVPLVLLLVAMVWQLLPMLATMQEAVRNHDQAALLSLVGYILLFELFGFVLLVSLTVGVTKLVLGREVKSPLFHLSLGKDFGRLLAADFLILLIVFGAIFALSIVMSIVIGILVATTSSARSPQEIALSIQRFQPLMILAIYSVMGFLFVRLAMLLPPITLVEKRIGLGRNWTLTKGNSWRILGVVVLVMLPLFLLGCVQFVAMAVIGGPEWNILDSFRSQEAQMAWSQNSLGLYTTYWYLYLPAWLLLTPIAYGSLIASSGLVYRALVPEDPAAP